MSSDRCELDLIVVIILQYTNIESLHYPLETNIICLLHLNKNSTFMCRYL